MIAALSPMPAVSVVMSCYNAERWLNESIESILNQTWRDFEFIIIDDGSADQTRQIIERYATRDARIVPIVKPNSGLTDSLNVGIARARGRWIARMDADDRCDPTRLEKQWRFAELNRAVVFIGTGLVHIDEQGRRLAAYVYPATHKGLLGHLRTYRKFPPHSSAFFRADAFRRIGGYRHIGKAEDWDLWLRFSEVGQLAALRALLVEIRQHPAQISHDESGMRQVLDAHRGMVAYWVRQMGHQDPIRADDFEAWLAKHLQEKKVFAVAAFRKRIRQRPTRNGRLGSLFGFAQECLYHPAHACRAVRGSLWGSPIPRQLAREWVEKRRGKGPGVSLLSVDSRALGRAQNAISSASG